MSFVETARFVSYVTLIGITSHMTVIRVVGVQSPKTHLKDCIGELESMENFFRH